ncbi:MAG: PAS domain-containing protein [Leptospiraceae bacterium]|nr:PAS domain-containing protein [Leptospiraceae bacterium]
MLISLQYTFIEGNSENLLGYTKEEWTSVDFWVNNVYSQDKEPTLKKFREILKNKKSNFLEYRFFTKHRKLSWIRDTIGVINNEVKPPLVQGIMIDITDHKRNENLLQFHSDILNKMSEGVFLLRTDDASIIYTNPSFDSMFGYETGELIGKHVSVLNSSEIKPSESKGAELLLSIVNDIMDFSKIESGEIEIESIKISLKEISDSMYEMFFARASEKGIEFKSSIDETISENLIGIL